MVQEEEGEEQSRGQVGRSSLLGCCFCNCCSSSPFRISFFVCDDLGGNVEERPDSLHAFRQAPEGHLQRSSAAYTRKRYMSAPAAGRRTQAYPVTAVMAG